MPHSNVSLNALKAAITIGDAVDDLRLRSVLEAVSAQVDLECRRSFRVRLATRYYTAACADRLELPDDLLSVTTLKTDSGADGTYASTWTAATDYALGPRNAASDLEPYWWVERVRNGGYSFPVGTPAGVQIVGSWGYRSDVLAVGTIAAAIVDATTTAVTMTAGHGLEALQTILIDSEQLYVTAVSTNALTVERGVNGTTAASHLILAPVSVYRYPGPVVEATRLQAARLFQRVHAPFGVQGSAELGTVAVISRIDPDVKLLLQHYRSGLGMVA